ncbi:hypothetical protein [Thermococcus sp.]
MAGGLELGVVRPYAYAALLTISLIGILTYRRVRDEWERLPPMRWKLISFLLGLMAILVASLMEYPFSPSLFSVGRVSLIQMTLLGIFVGPIEEFSKLLPVKIFREEGWVLWKKTLGTAFFFGLIEAVLYSIMLLIIGQLLMALLRLALVGLHVALTFIAATELIAGGSWRGYLRASAYHSLYDLPLLVYVGGYRGEGIYVLMALGFLSLTAVAVEVLRTGGVAERVLGEEESPQELEFIFSP